MALLIWFQTISTTRIIHHLNVKDDGELRKWIKWMLPWSESKLSPILLKCLICTKKRVLHLYESGTRSWAKGAGIIWKTAGHLTFNYYRRSHPDLHHFANFRCWSVPSGMSRDEAWKIGRPNLWQKKFRKNSKRLIWRRPNWKKQWEPRQVEVISHYITTRR